MAATVAPITVKAGAMEFTLSPAIHGGDNPAFYAAQVEAQLIEIGARARRIIEAATGRRQFAGLVATDDETRATDG